MKQPDDSFQFKIALKDGIKVIELLSRPYYQQFLNTKTKVGEVGSMHLTFKKPTRTESQLRYYAVIIGLLAAHTGYTWEEMHQALMILKWGTREIKVNGYIVRVRRSISNKAKFPKDFMSEQIEFALESCREYEIRVPTRKELGYIDN